MRTGFLITARLKSTRLEKKLLLKVHDREIIAWMIDRLKLSNGLDEIIIATSTNEEDTPLCDIAEREGIGCFRGSELDVLERLYMGAREYELDYMVNITADCPMVAYDFVDRLVKHYEETGADLITSFDLPHGFFIYGIDVGAMGRALEIKNTEESEIWTNYFTETGLFKVSQLPVPDEYRRDSYRLTLDYPEDWEFFQALYSGLGPDAYKKSSRDVLEYLDAHPDIVAINSDSAEKWKARWESQKRTELK